MSKFDALALIREDSGAREAGTQAAPKPPRPPGKRKNPAYRQISAYVRRDLYEKIQHELIGKSEDFSDLLEHWMEKSLDQGR